jgi:hypothetical protein
MYDSEGDILKDSLIYIRLAYALEYCTLGKIELSSSCSRAVGGVGGVGVRGEGKELGARENEAEQARIKVTVVAKR